MLRLHRIFHRVKTTRAPIVVTLLGADRVQGLHHQGELHVHRQPDGQDAVCGPPVLAALQVHQAAQVLRRGSEAEAWLAETLPKTSVIKHRFLFVK